MLPETVIPRAAWAEQHPLLEFLRQTVAVAEAELRKLFHDPQELITRSVQPALWLIVFGRVFSRLRDMPTGGIPYLDFIAPGILAQSVLFVSVSYGIALIWERDLGILHKFLSSPASRSALVLGKTLSAALRTLPHAAVVYGLAVLLGVRVRANPGMVLQVIAFTSLGAMLFCALSLIVACLLRTRQRFMGINQLLLMPLFFASNALYPLKMMNGWLQRISGFNPLTYLVDALRAAMVRGGQSTYGLSFDLTILSLIVLLLVAIATKIYPRLIY